MNGDREIHIPWPDLTMVSGITAEVPVVVDWFEPLTDDQIVANSVSMMNSGREPYPDPNFIRVVLHRV